MKRKFIDLPLGTRFRYLPAQRCDNQVFVILENWGYGLIAKWNGWEAGPHNQFVSFADNEEDTKTWEVEVVG